MQMADGQDQSLVEKCANANEKHSSDAAGNVFKILPNGNLCINLDSISLPLAAPVSSMNTDSQPKEVGTGNCRKFSARTPVHAIGISNVCNNEASLSMVPAL